MEALIAKLSAQMLQFLALPALITTNPATGFFSALFGAWLATWGRRRWRQEPGAVWKGAMRAGGVLLAVTPTVALALAVVGTQYVVVLPDMPRSAFYSPLVGLICWAVGAGAGALLGRRREPLPGEAIDPAVEAKRRRLGRVALWGFLLAVPLAGVAPGVGGVSFFAALIALIVRANTRGLVTERTDARTVLAQLPSPKSDYDPAAEIGRDPRQAGVFVGRNREGAPVRLPYDVWKSSHVQIVGTTGAGKGVASSLLLAQALKAGEAAFVIDPKDDEWAPSVLAHAARAAGVPFCLVDLREPWAQVDLLAGATQRDTAELIEAAFSLAPRGEAADHYRLADRRAARRLADARELGEGLSDLYRRARTDLGLANAIAGADGFMGNLEELVETVPAISGGAGECAVDLRDVVDRGGCVYVVGGVSSAMRAAQRAVLIRVIQIAAARDRTAGGLRPVRIFADEFKYSISRPALDALALARDKGIGLILAHQSLSDLRDTPADLRPDAVAGAVVENCAVKIVYRVHDADTADWLSRLSGTVLARDESEGPTGRSVRMVDRGTIDPNMLIRLPARVAVLYQGGHVPVPVHICPIRAQKVRVAPVAPVADPLAVPQPTAAAALAEDLFNV